MDNNELKIEIGARIKKLRTELGLTQEEFAKQIGVSGKTIIANYESGYSTPNDEIRLKICSLCNCSIDYLLGVSGVCETNSNTDFHVGLSKSEEGTLTKEEKEEIKNFAKFVMSKRGK